MLLSVCHRGHGEHIIMEEGVGFVAVTQDGGVRLKVLRPGNSSSSSESDAQRPPHHARCLGELVTLPPVLRLSTEQGCARPLRCGSCPLQRPLVASVFVAAIVSEFWWEGSTEI